MGKGYLWWIMRDSCLLTQAKKKFLLKPIFLFFCSGFLYLQNMHSQPCVVPVDATKPPYHCDVLGLGSTYVMSTSNQVDFTFDTFGKYLAGITQNGATILKLTVSEAIAPCRWRLNVYLDNWAAAPAGEWKLSTPYGTSGTNANVNLLEVNVHNDCSTPILNNIFFNFAAINVFQPIISSPLVTNPSGACGTNVNGPGNYQTNYSAYHFVVDYKIKPSFTIKPGVYQIAVHYCLTEDL